MVEMYPVDTLSREVGRYNENFVKKGRALGELGTSRWSQL